MKKVQHTSHSNGQQPSYMGDEEITYKKESQLSITLSSQRLSALNTFDSFAACLLLPQLFFTSIDVRPWPMRGSFKIS